MIQKAFDAKQGVEVIHFEDDHGTQHVVQVYISQQSCPLCHHPYEGAADAGIDHEATLNRVQRDLEAREQKIHEYKATRKA